MANEEHITALRAALNDGRVLLEDMDVTIEEISDLLTKIKDSIDDIERDGEVSDPAYDDSDFYAKRFPRRAWSDRSIGNLVGVHPALIQLAAYVLYNSPLDILIVDGVRTKAEQAALVASGASRTMDSYHLTGHAIDFVPLIGGKVSYHWEHYHQVAPYFKRGADFMGLDMTWAGDWKIFPDGAHIQIDKNTPWQRVSVK